MTWQVGQNQTTASDPVIGDVAQRRAIYDGSMPCSDADAIFRNDPGLRSILVHCPDGIRLVGRAQFHDSLAGPKGYGFALYGNKPLSSLPAVPALIVTAATPCEWVTRQVLIDGYLTEEDVLVDFGDGFGTVAVATLLDHLWNLSQRRADHIEGERRRLHALVDHSSDFTLIVDRHGVLQWANIVDRRTFPYANVLDGVEADDIAHAWDLLTTAVALPGESLETELRFRVQAGQHRLYAASFRNLSTDPAIGGIVVSMRDIENERRLEHQLHVEQTTDALTGLTNRAVVVTDFDNRLARGEFPTLLWLDLDGFKIVNDRFGHPTGDAVLQEVSRRLRNLASLDDTVARFDADEFTVLTSHADDPGAFGERVRDALSRPIDVNGASIRISATIGVATLGAEDMSADELIEHTELALAEARSRGRNNVVVFEPALEFAARQRDAMRGRLRVALDTDAFSLVFQPQMALDSHQPLRGFEALIRWPDAARGSIPPDEFIPLAEQSGDIVEIGRWVLTGALEQLAEWQRYGAELTISVNASIRELAEVDFAPFVRGELERFRIDPKSLEIEITETALATDDVAVNETLERLRDIGVHIAVDDYGSGNASVAYLRRYPISTIKVDRDLVAMLEHDRPTASALLRSITDVARALGLRSVVEGLENAEQTAYARELGFDLGQGWHCGMPMSALRASKLVAVARRDASAPQSTMANDSLASFEKTLAAFDEANAEHIAAVASVESLATAEVAAHR